MHKEGKTLHGAVFFKPCVGYFFPWTLLSLGNDLPLASIINGNPHVQIRFKEKKQLHRSSEKLDIDKDGTAALQIMHKVVQHWLLLILL